MPPIGPIIAAGANLLGGIMTNSQNAQNVASANRLNYQIFKEQNQYNLEQWHRTNEYNTPLAQRMRYEQAGINPSIALGNITPGVAQATTSASANPMQAPQAVNPVPASIDAYIQSKQADASIELTKAEIANKQADTAGKLINNNKLPEYLQKQVELLVSNAVKNYSEANRNDALTPVQAEQIKASIEEIKSKVDMSKIEQRIKSYELDNLLPAQKAMFIATIREKTAQLGLISSQIGLNRASASEALQRIVMYEAQTKGIDISNDIAKRTADDIVATVGQEKILREEQTMHEYQLARILGIQADRMQNNTDIYMSMLQSLTGLAGGMYSANMSYGSQMQSIQSNNMLGNARMEQQMKMHNDKMQMNNARMQQQQQMHNDKMELNWQNHFSRTRK